MDIDNLQIALEATSDTAVDAIDTLVDALDKMASSLGKISSPVTKAVNSLDKLNAAFGKVGDSSVVVSGADKAAASLDKVKDSAAATANTLSTSMQNAAQKSGEAVLSASQQARLELTKQQAEIRAAARERMNQSDLEKAREMANIRELSAARTVAAREQAKLESQLSEQSQNQEYLNFSDYNRPEAPSPYESPALFGGSKKYSTEEADSIIQSQINSSAGTSATATSQLKARAARESATAVRDEAQAERESASAAESTSSRSVSAFDRIRAGAQRIRSAVANMFSGSGASASAGISELQELNTRLDNANEGIRIQQLRVQQLRNEWNKAFSAAGQNEAAESVIKLDNSILSANNSLLRYQVQARNAQSAINELANANERAASSTSRAESGSNSLSNAFSRMGRQLASQLIIYAMLWPAISATGQYIGSALMTNDAFASSLNNLKVQLLTAFYPIYQAVLPALTALVQGLATAMSYIASFISSLFGMTYSQANQGAAALNKNIADMQNKTKTDKQAQEQSKAWDTYNKKLTKQQDDYSAAVEKAQKRQDKLNQAREDAKKALMGFDEINQLSKVNSDYETVEMPEQPTAPEAPSAASPIANTGTLSGILNTNFDITQAKILDSVKQTIAEIGAILSGAMLVLGAIFAFTGVNIPLGIGLMAVGAAGLATVALNWGALSAPVQQTLLELSAIVGGALLTLGAIFAFTGVNIPLGIAFMLMGAAGIAPAALNWNALTPQIQGVLTTIAAAVGLALLPLGAILAFSGVNIPLGIAFMVIGATGLAAAALNWNAIPPQVQNVLSIIAAVVGGALLALGLMLALTGAALPLGIGLMAVGALSLGGAIALNWNAVVGPLRTVVSTILTIASSASLAIGLLLCLTGAGIPLGIGLILAGVGGMFASAAIGTNPILEWARNMMNGVISVFESGVNWIISMLDRIQFSLPSWVPGIGGQEFGINIQPVHIPRLASGGITDINNPFLSVVGDNMTQREVVSPLDDLMGMIKSAVSETVAVPAAPASSSGTGTNFDSKLDRIADAIALAVSGGNDGQSGDLILNLSLDAGGPVVTQVKRALKRDARRGNDVAVPA